MADKDNVVVAVYDHKHGTDVRVFRDEAAAYAWRTEIAEAWWDTEFPGEDTPSSDVIGERYFDGMIDMCRDSESFTVHFAVVEEN